MVSLLPILGAFLSGCTGSGRPDDSDPIDTDDSGGDDTDDTSTPPVDADGDGYTSDVDCDDETASLYKTVEGYGDHDNDGYFADDSQVTSGLCGGDDAIEDGYSLTPGDDCDDNWDYIHPDAAQRLNGIDTNCDGNLDIDLDRDATTIEIGQYDGVAGGSAAAFGDVDGDGLSDVIIASSNEEVVYGVLGSSGKLAPGETLTMPNDADFAIHWTDNGLTQIGYSVAMADLDVDPDEDGKKRDEILLGAPGYNNAMSHDWDGLGKGTDSGAIIVISGRTAFDPEYEINYDSLTSAATLSSLDMAVIEGWENSGIGQYVHATGDIDGDSYGEIIAGDFSHCYAVPARAYSGVQEITDLYDPDTYGGGHYIQDNDGTPYTSTFCENVTGGDVDGDGLTDLLMANPADENHDGAGEVVLLMGATNLPSSFNIYDLTDSIISSLRYLVFDGNGASASAGSSLAMNDLDGDGKAEVIIGVPGENDWDGRVYTVPGADLSEILSGTDADFESGDHISLDGDVYLAGGKSISSIEDEATLGTSINGASDTNDDGAGDLLLGLPFYDNDKGGLGAGFYLGGVTLTDYSGDDIILESEAEHDIADTTVDNFGETITGGGDVDGDGSDEALINAPSGPNATSRGVSYLFFGGPQ